MTMVVTRVREISDREGFDIIVTRRGKPISVKRNGVLDKYPFDRKLKGSATVETWRRDRFEAAYPGYSCEILMGNGKTARGNTNLKTVRDSY